VVTLLVACWQVKQQQQQQQQQYYQQFLAVAGLDTA
jgi:hypothetical protein